MEQPNIKYIDTPIQVENPYILERNVNTNPLDKYGSISHSGIKIVDDKFLVTLGTSNISNFSSIQTYVVLNKEQLIKLGEVLIKIAENN